MLDDAQGEAKSQVATKPFFLFELDGELFAVLANQVERVMKMPPVTPIPNAPRAIVGIFHLRGKVVVALDLVGRMNMPKSKPLTANYLFVIHHQRNQFAILVDHPRAIIEVNETEIKNPNSFITAHVPPQYIQGVFVHDDVFTSRKKERSIIMGPAGVALAKGAEPKTVHRPVLWLNIDTLLDQDDLREIVASHDGGI